MGTKTNDAGQFIASKAGLSAKLHVNVCGNSAGVQLSEKWHEEYLPGSGVTG
jgi:hypothetical protein